MSHAAAGEQELRAIQADAFGAGVAGRGEVVGELDVGVEPDRTPSAVVAGRAPLGVDAAPGRPVVGVTRRRAPASLVVGIDDQLARRCRR